MNICEQISITEKLQQQLCNNHYKFNTYVLIKIIDYWHQVMGLNLIPNASKVNLNVVIPTRAGRLQGAATATASFEPILKADQQIAIFQKMAVLSRKH